MRVVCIDDEPLILEHLSSKLQQMREVKVVDTYAYPIEGLDHILKNEVDALFLDINLPDIKGVDLARQILEEKPHIPIVFLTAHQQYAVEAFELEAVDYIMKPIQTERLQSAVKRIQRKLNAMQLSLVKKKQLYIKVSNHLAFSTNGVKFSPLKWRTSKAEELFLFLLHHRGNLVDKFAIKATIWEDFDVSDSLLHTTISYIRKSLKDYQGYITIRLRGQAYFLEMVDVHVDLFDWENSLDSISPFSSQTIEKYEKVMKQNEDVYLKQYSFIWLEAEKERLELLWADTTKRMADFYVIDNKVDKAFSAYRQISERQPENEEAHFLLMKLYAKNGHIKQASNQYQELTSIMQKNLDATPSEHIQQWYNNLLFVLQNE